MATTSCAAAVTGVKLDAKSNSRARAPALTPVATGTPPLRLLPCIANAFLQEARRSSRTRSSARPTERTWPGAAPTEATLGRPVAGISPHETVARRDSGRQAYRDVFTACLVRADPRRRSPEPQRWQ